MWLGKLSSCSSYSEKKQIAAKYNPESPFPYPASPTNRLVLEQQEPLLHAEIVLTPRRASTARSQQPVCGGGPSASLQGDSPYEESQDE